MFTSACIDAGMTIAGFADDIDRDARPSGARWDIGADELLVVRLEEDPLKPGRTALVVHGSAANDTIVFGSLNAGRIVTVQVNGNSYGQYLASTLSRLIAYGHDGNDRITVASNLSVAAFLSGGNGDDTLQGGRGNDVLLGGRR